MSRRTPSQDFTPVIDAFRTFADQCLVADGSIFTKKSLWTPQSIEDVKVAFVDHPDLGKDDFMTKLKRQMKDAPPDAQQLMAEMLWALLLFPSNVKQDTKRQHIRGIWSLSGEPLDESSTFLSDEVLDGIGSGGPGFNNHRWRELVFMIGLAGTLKQKTPSERRVILTDYDQFMSWIESVEQEGYRQFRHMMRFFLFPDRVERMSSSKERRKVLEGFGRSPSRKASDRELDEGMLKLREELEAQYPGDVLDFYEPPLRVLWQPEQVEEIEHSKVTNVIRDTSAERTQQNGKRRPKNLILYGPPGTGKTYWLREQMAEYTDGGIRRFRLVTFHPSYSYEDFVGGIRPVEVGKGETQFRLVDGVFKVICDEARAQPSKRFALFIDEINRANISKVFGELISLIEVDKRGVFDGSGTLVEGMCVTLPGRPSDEAAFAVPANLDIFGTMNTADRSIALLDIALRRRFEFQEMEPDYSLLDDDVEGVHLADLLTQINDRLEYLLDRDHRIGHAYLIEVADLNDLRRVFRTQIIPLLQEFFFDDLSRVAMVLATSGPPFVAPERLKYSVLFSGPRSETVPDERHRYAITDPARWTADSFQGIYGALTSET